MILINPAEAKGICKYVYVLNVLYVICYKEGLLPSKEGLHCSKALNGVPPVGENRRDECAQSRPKQVCRLQWWSGMLRVKVYTK